ncbi:MAG: glycoside hydrolase family 19 protein [Flavipsychrobacter sp.]
MAITSNKGYEGEISVMQMHLVMPGAPSGSLNSFLAELNKQLPLYNITTPLRIAAFIAQGSEETGELRQLTENMNYSASRIMQVWPSRFHTIEAARSYEHNPEKLGNYVYADRMGNGHPESGDGYKYRGRGWFNGTGKSFYRRMSDLTGTDFITNPDLLATPKFAVQSACEEWRSWNLNALADAQNIKAITKKINGGYTNLADRLRLYNKAKTAFGLNS